MLVNMDIIMRVFMKILIGFEVDKPSKILIKISMSFSNNSMSFSNIPRIVMFRTYV